MLWNALILAVRAMRRNLLRSSLTTLGIVIGVAAVIIMVTVGTGVTQQVTADIAKLGSNLLMVHPGQRNRGGASAAATPFRADDAEAIEREVRGVAVVAPSSSRPAMAIFGNENHSTTVTGTDNRYLTARDWAVAAGREFNEGELRAGRAVCILGATVRKELFGRQEAIGSQIRLKQLSCRVIGVLEAKGGTMGMDQDDLVLIPLRTFWRRIAGNQDVRSLFVSARDGESTESAQAEVTALLRERRRIQEGEDDDFNVTDMKEISSMLSATTGVLTALLGAVAAVSLLVGGIGIMNIMLVSVTERTREIGIRLAIGALERDVLLQFLVEAMVLSSFGGLLGIGLAYGASFGLTSAMGVPFVFDPVVVLAAFVFSAVVGVIFGYFPARKAARLDPIDALRHE